MTSEPIEGREPIELPSNNGKIRVVFDLVPRSPLPRVRPGALTIRKSYWDRTMLLNGQYSQSVPDARVELFQVLFADESLRRLATELLRWSELDFSILVRTPLMVEIDLLFEA